MMNIKSDKVKAFFFESCRGSVSLVNYSYDEGDIATVDRDWLHRCKGNGAVEVEQIFRSHDDGFEYAFRWPSPMAEVVIKPWANHPTMAGPGELVNFGGAPKFKQINGRMIPVSILFLTDHLRLWQNLWHQYLEAGILHPVKDKPALIELLKTIQKEENGIQRLNLSVINFVD